MNIKSMSSSHTTAQMLKILRSHFSDDNILLMAREVSRGTYEAFSAIINKEVSGSYSSEEREKNEFEDGHDYE